MLHVFINPRSGSGAGRRLAERWGRFAPVLIDLEGLEARLAESVREGDVVVVGGGDGTVSLVVGALFRLGLGGRVRVAPYPLGTGNDLARSLGYAAPPDPAAFIDALAAGEATRRALAVWQADGGYFVNYLSMGLDARVLQTADAWRGLAPVRPAWRRLSLVLAGLRHLGYRIREDVVVTTDDGAFNLRGTRGLILSNVGSYAGGCRVGATDPGDPRLGVTVLRAGADLGRLLRSRYRRTAAVPDHTLTRAVRLEGPPLPVEVDGEVATLWPRAIACAGRVEILTYR